MDVDTPSTETQAESGLSRRDFTAAAAAAGVTGVAGSALAALPVVAAEVSIKTADGTCDAALFHPAGHGAWPAVIMFPDALGLRPASRDMGRRLAESGYVVLVPNPFYRLTKAPGMGPKFDFANPADRARLTELRAPLTTEAVGRDTLAYLAFLDSHKAVNTRAKAGTVGYCMGGLMTVQASAAAPGRVGASASFHGGGLVTDGPDSPHLLVPKIKARYYFGVAANDDERQPEAKTVLRDAFAAAGNPAKIEVYPGAMHGWCMADFPIYNAPAAERAWAELLALYKTALA